LNYSFKAFSDDSRREQKKNKKIRWAEKFCLAMIMKHIMLRAIYIFFLEKMLKLFVMLINIATLILKGRSQRRAEGQGPFPIECCLALLRTKNEQVSGV